MEEKFKLAERKLIQTFRGGSSYCPYLLTNPNGIEYYVPSGQYLHYKVNLYRIIPREEVDGQLVEVLDSAVYYDIDFELGFPENLGDKNRSYFGEESFCSQYLTNRIWVSFNENVGSASNNIFKDVSGDENYNYNTSVDRGYSSHYRIVYGRPAKKDPSSGNFFSYWSPQSQSSLDPIDGYYYYSYPFYVPKRDMELEDTDYQGYMFKIDNSYNQTIFLECRTSFYYDDQWFSDADGIGTVMLSDQPFATIDTKTLPILSNLQITPEYYIMGDVGLSWQNGNITNGKTKIYRIPTLFNEKELELFKFQNPNKNPEVLNGKYLIGDIYNTQNNFTDTDIPSYYLQWHYVFEPYTEAWLDSNNKPLQGIILTSKNINRLGCVATKIKNPLDETQTMWRRTIGWIKKGGKWRQIVNFFVKIKTDEVDPETNEPIYEWKECQY